MKTLSIDEVNLLRKNARSVVRELGLLNDAYFGIGVTLAERHLLIELSSCIYPTISEIAERLLLDKSTASRLIAKAVKKGYIKYSTDEMDKRKRFLQLSSKGEKVLNTFEPIAFQQTEEALLTLTDSEIEKVYQGIALYARGLKNSRLRSKIEFTRISKNDKAGFAQLLKDYQKQLHSLGIIQAKTITESLNWNEKHPACYFVMKMEKKWIAGIEIVPLEGSRTCELKKVYMQADKRGLGLESILLENALQEAKKMGLSGCYIDVSQEMLVPREVWQEQGFQTYKNNKNNLLLWKAC